MVEGRSFSNGYKTCSDVTVSPNAKSQVKIKVKSQPDQGKRSKSNVRYVQVNIWGSAYPVGRLILRVLMRDGPEVPMLIDRTSGPALWGSAFTYDKCTQCSQGQLPSSLEHRITIASLNTSLVRL